MNLRSVSVRHEGLSSKVERLNGTVRKSRVRNGSRRRRLTKKEKEREEWVAGYPGEKMRK